MTEAIDTTTTELVEKTEEQLFEEALANAPALAKKRMMRKMMKRIYRPLEWLPAEKGRPAGLYCVQPRSPSDLEIYYRHFVITYTGRGTK